MKASFYSILALSALAAALPKYPPTRFDPDDIDDADITSLPSAPSHTPMHTTVLMAMAMQRAAPTPLHTTILMAGGAMYTSRSAAPPASTPWLPESLEL